jgi:hypothetical protein
MKADKSMPDSGTAATVAPINPLIDKDDPLDTLKNVKGVIWFLDLTIPYLIQTGSNDDATHGLAMILEGAAQALDHATLAVETRGVQS